MDLQNGSIGLDKPTNWTGRRICDVTGEEVSHVKQYLNGFTFERTIWWVGYWWKSGILVTRGALPADFYGQPKEPFSQQEIGRMLDYWLGELRIRTPYNIPKLLGMYLAVKLGWRVPFQSRWLGDICSPTVDKAIKRAPRDALPGRGEQATTPGAFLASPLFNWTVAPPQKAIA